MPGATLTAPLRVQVVSVAISPVEVTIFVGHGQQFSAQVAGASDTGVTWSVQEPTGGSINTTGLFVGLGVGDFHIVATSTANAAQKGVAIAHVREKSKDKEKEKEKDKEKDKEISKDITKDKEIRKEVAKEIEKAPRESVPIVPRGPRVDPGPIEVGRSFDAGPVEQGEASGRSFIRPDERPDLTKPPKRET